MNGLDYRLMAIIFGLRDMIKPPQRVLEEARVRAGQQILDYGCGPGSYSIAAARLTGKRGTVYALDVNPLAIRSVQKKSAGKGLPNIVTIQSDCRTGLGDKSIDRVLLYDIYHILTDPRPILKEIYRVMKDDAELSFSDHHMTTNQIIRNDRLIGYFEPIRFSDSSIAFRKRESVL